MVIEMKARSPGSRCWFSLAGQMCQLPCSAAWSLLLRSEANTRTKAAKSKTLENLEGKTVLSLLEEGRESMTRLAVL